MRVLIVEDETAAYDNLVTILHDVDPSLQVAGNTESIRQTVKWLQQHPAPDLIFMDIHLSDGSAFNIFNAIAVEIPVIFTTAYDQYAIDAFKVNSIDYLLKPINTKQLTLALKKFRKLNRQDVEHYLARLSQLLPTGKYMEKVLVPIHDRLVLLPLSEVPFFYTTGRNTRVYMNDGKSYPYPKTLDGVMELLDPNKFFRANKQFIIAKESITNITIWFDNRLLITLSCETPERIYISRNKAAEFKQWVVM